MKFIIDRRHLARLMAGRPAILLVGADAAQFADAGLELWYGQRLDGARVLISADVDAQVLGDEVEISAPPTGILAVMLADDELQEIWAEWFSVHQAAHVPEFVKSGGGGAVRAIVARLARERAEAIRESADLHLALVRLRQDFDQMTAASLEMVRALSYRPPGAAWLEFACEPSGGVIVLNKLHPILVQPLGIRVDRIAGVEIAVAGFRCSEEDTLRVRLSGVESGRIFGSWLVHSGAFAEGWLVLELPASSPAAPETAQLEFHFTCGKQGRLELSKDRNPAFEGNIPFQPGARASDRALAVKIWCSDRGSRFVLAEHWDESECGAGTHPAGIPLAMPLSAFGRVRVVNGGMPKPYSSPDSGPMLIGMSGGRQVLVIFPLVAIAGMDLVEADFGLRGGDMRNLMLSVWLQPMGHEITCDADLRTSGPDVAWSGWRGFETSGTARVVLELPSDTSGNVQLVAVIDASARPAAGVSLIEIHKILFSAFGASQKVRRRSALVGALPDAGGLVPRVLAVDADLADAGDPAPSYREVILDEHFDNGGPYRHLDMRLRGFSAGGCYWPFLKFRVVVERGEPCLEFRNIASWPPSLKNWPENSDEQGKLVRLFGREIELAPLAAGAAAEDLVLIGGLVQCLPGVVGKAALLAGLDPAHVANWTSLAEKLAIRLTPHSKLQLHSAG
jgi:hypothetical protein